MDGHGQLLLGLLLSDHILVKERDDLAGVSFMVAQVHGRAGIALE
jgi:hypothetical protein